MKPLHKLKARDKAKLLFDLFPKEVGGLIAHLKLVVIETIDDEEELQRVWGNQVVDAGHWQELALSVSKRMNASGDDLNYCRKKFSDVLFRKGVFLFTVHALIRYSNLKECPPKFSEAIWLLFTPKNNYHEIFNEFRQYRESETFA